MPAPVDRNAGIIEEFRANAGVVGGYFEGKTLLLLHHTGAKSGVERVSPVMYRAEGDRLFVFASKGGAPDNPSWYHNLRANPDAEVEVGIERFPVVATILEGRERDEVFGRQAAEHPQFADYEAKSSRVIPVIALDRR